MLSDLTQQAMRGDREALTSLASIVGDRMAGRDASAEPESRPINDRFLDSFRFTD